MSYVWCYWYRCCVNNSLNEAGLTNDSDCVHYVGNDIVMVALLVMNVNMTSWSHLSKNGDLCFADLHILFHANVDFRQQRNQRRSLQRLLVCQQ